MASFSYHAARLCERWAAPLLSRIEHRARWWRFGLFPITSSLVVRHLHIAGKHIHLRFPEGEFKEQQWELAHLFMDDPYGLRRMRGELKTVLDVGGNIGLFALLCRHYFPAAVIHCYEPSPGLREVLNHNTSGLNIKTFGQGIGSSNGLASMTGAINSLNGELIPSSDGDVVVVSIAEALDRLGGRIDLMKLDCEGAEWDILDASGALERTDRLAMEYHLDKGTSKSLPVLVALLKSRGFAIQSLVESSTAPVGQLIAIKEDVLRAGA